MEINKPGLTFGPDDGPALVDVGKPMKKKPNPVYMIQVRYPFKVMTNEGLLDAPANSWLAHDPISGHVWPIDPDYVAVHYEPVT